MNFHFEILLFCFLIQNNILDIRSSIPGDPFPIEISNDTNKSVALETTTQISSTINDTTETLLLTSTVNTIDQSSLTNFSSEHLVDIAQWKYTDLRTRKVRYWYHILGTSMGSGWIFDRIICRAYIRPKPDTCPIRAYHSEKDGTWTNTLQIESNPMPIGNNQWIYDGTPFYAYKTSMNSSLLKPVWRYWNRINYGTEDVSEPRRSYLRMGDSDDDELSDWKLDRIIFYAFEPHSNMTEFNK